MSNNGIIDIIRKKLLSDFLGKENAKRRSVLLTHCHYFEPGLDDRTMRRHYTSILPVAYTTERNEESETGGIYVVDDIQEVDKAISTRTKTKEAHEKAIESLGVYKEYLIQREKEEEAKKSRQLGLFQPMEASDEV